MPKSIVVENVPMRGEEKINMLVEKISCLLEDSGMDYLQSKVVINRLIDQLDFKAKQINLRMFKECDLLVRFILQKECWESLFCTTCRTKLFKREQFIQDCFLFDQRRAPIAQLVQEVLFLDFLCVDCREYVRYEVFEFLLYKCKYQDSFSNHINFW